MSDAFVVADAHGRLDLIKGLLALAGAERGPGRTIVQLGDLANCVASSIEDDLATLRAAPDLFDVILVGNHEHPYFGGPLFAGYWRDPQVANAIRKIDWQAAFSSGEFLVTHAGLGEALARDAAGNARKLNDAWTESPGHHPYFASDGGILWTRGMKVTAGFSQIIGRTPGSIRVQGMDDFLGRDVRFVDGRPFGFDPDEPFVLCIDLGASKGGADYSDPSSTRVYPRGDRLAGCWIRDGLVEIVVYDNADLA